MKQFKVFISFKAGNSMLYFESGTSAEAVRKKIPQRYLINAEKIEVLAVGV